MLAAVFVMAAVSCLRLLCVAVATVVAEEQALKNVQAHAEIGAGGSLAKVTSSKLMREERRLQSRGGNVVEAEMAHHVHPQLCKSLHKVISEKSCEERGIAVFLEKEAPAASESMLEAVGTWPIRGCNLPQPAARRSLEELVSDKAKDGASPCTMAIALTTKNAESFYGQLPAGALLVVATSPNDEGAEGLVWQSMYQVNSNRYFDNLREWNKEFVPELQQFTSEKKFGLPDLQFSTYLPGHIILQKADTGTTDVELSKGTFWNLANEFGTDKIDDSHNYSLLYHRHLDHAGTFNHKGSMMLEIGLGCILERGNAARAGASAKIWPRMFPHTAVHFIEIDRECTAKWHPQMLQAGVAKVHVGGQSDDEVLSNVIKDSKFYQPGGFVSVIDDGSHLPVDMETSFRALFPHLKSGGLYFVEDIMFAAWQAYYSDRRMMSEKKELIIDSKSAHSSDNPIALSAVLAAAATGVAPVPDNPTDEGFKAPTVKPDTSLFGPLSDAFNNFIAIAKEPFTNQNIRPVTKRVPSALHPKEWRQEILDRVAGFVDFVECSPGICVYRKK